MRGKIAVLVLALASGIYLLERFVVKFLLNALVVPSIGHNPRPSLVLYFSVVWGIVAVMLMTASMLVAWWSAIRGWRLLASSVSAAVLSGLLVWFFTWLLTFASFGFALIGWSSVGAGLVVFALVWSGVTVTIAWLIARGIGLTGTRRTSAST